MPVPIDKIEQSIDTIKIKIFSETGNQESISLEIESLNESLNQDKSLPVGYFNPIINLIEMFIKTNKIMPLDLLRTLETMLQNLYNYHYKDFVGEEEPDSDLEESIKYDNNLIPNLYSDETLPASDLDSDLEDVSEIGAVNQYINYESS
ncbi:MAG: hypothetical protein ACIPMY_02020 [Rickettsia endosymbiont of Pentastiridius leporinus]